MKAVLSIDAVQALIHKAFPQFTDEQRLVVEAIDDGKVRIRWPYSPWMLRPGNVLSGPALMTAADTAMYVAVLSHVGAQLMAVTVDMNLRFLHKADPGDIIVEAKILKLGRKLIVMDCHLYSSADPQRLVMHATGSYALPSPKNLS